MRGANNLEDIARLVPGVNISSPAGNAQRITIRGNVITRTGGLMNRPDGSFWPEGFEDATEWPTPISWPCRCG